MAKLKMGSGIAGEKGEIDEREGQGRDKMEGQDGGIHDGFNQMGLSGLLI